MLMRYYPGLGVGHTYPCTPNPSPTLSKNSEPSQTAAADLTSPFNEALPALGGPTQFQTSQGLYGTTEEEEENPEFCLEDREGDLEDRDSHDDDSLDADLISSSDTDLDLNLDDEPGSYEGDV